MTKHKPIFYRIVVGLFYRIYVMNITSLILCNQNLISVYLSIILKNNHFDSIKMNKW